MNPSDLFANNKPKLVFLRKRRLLETGAVSSVLRFRTSTGSRGELEIPNRLIAAPHKVREQLLDQDADIPSDSKTAIDEIKAALVSTPKLRMMDITVRGGWHNGAFVQPGWCVGNVSYRIELVGSDPTATASRKGSRQAWKTGLQPVCDGSSYATFAIGTAFAGPLLEIIGDAEGAIFNFHGSSSTGKSLSGRLCQSVIDAAGKNDLATYGITRRALEELCARRNDTVVVLDEQARVDGSPRAQRRTIRKTAYEIPSGKGVLRAKVVGTTLPPLSWRTMGFTCGETALDDPAEDARQGGERVRHIDIAMPSLADGGIFDRLRGDDRPARAKALAKLAEETIAENHGVALRPYVRYLAKNRDEVRIQVKEIIDDFTSHHGCDGDSWRRRYTLKFALVAAGMILAANAGVAPWTVKHAKRCASRIFKDSVWRLLSVEERARDMVGKLRLAITHEERFPELAKGEAINKARRRRIKGFHWRHIRHGDVVAIEPEFFEGLAGPDHSMILDWLIAHDMAIRDPKKRHLQIAVMGLGEKRRRWVALRHASLVV